MNRFFVPQACLENGVTVAITDDQDVKHIRKVLRLRPGNSLEVADGKGREAVAVITDLSDAAVTVKIEAILELQRESPLEITLFQALPKGPKLETVFQKNTEIGVAAFVPVISERCVVRISDLEAERKKHVRWQAIIDEAAKQSKRGTLPRLEKLVDLKTAAAVLGAYDLVLVPHTGSGVVVLNEALPKGTVRRVAVFIGPEGGFTDEEAGKLAEAGAIPVTLGPRILRTETAGFVISSILQYVYGDMGGTVS